MEDEYLWSVIFRKVELNGRVPLKFCTQYVNSTHVLWLGHLRLGKLYYDCHQIPNAILQWEYVLRRDPENVQAHEYLALVDAIDVIHTDIGARV